MDYAAVRHNMVESQIRTNDVTSVAVIAAMGEIPREKFVPQDKADIAYVDEAIAVADGRYLMEPMVFARLLQIAQIGEDDDALDIGCGTGYSSAVLASVAGTVVAVEEDADLAQKASALLTELGIDNAAVIEGPLVSGYAKQAPYDVIVFSGAVEEVPVSFVDQLADGGRLICIRTKGDGLGRGIQMTKSGDQVAEKEVFDAGSPLLPGFAKKTSFTF
ncbi:MAG TPA: protein-L-isoaspartate O-methyltransferase [Nitrospinaceae bacterium]|nr:protein-L-isoaspartate O-methyltransferase [Nitrospinaceae bacterium]